MRSTLFKPPPPLDPTRTLVAPPLRRRPSTSLAPPPVPLSRFTELVNFRSTAMSPGVLGSRAAHSPPPHVAGESSGASPPLRVGPAALAVRRRSACRLPPQGERALESPSVSSLFSPLYPSSPPSRSPAPPSSRAAGVALAVVRFLPKGRRR
jgi:hypothetical protein